MISVRRLFVNAIANIVNGFSNVILGIAIAPFLLSKLSLSEFAVWNLTFQCGVFFSLLGIGGQLTVARHVSLAKAQNNFKNETATIKHGLRLSYISAAIGLIALCFVYLNFYSIFDGVSASSVPNGDFIFLIISLSHVLGIISFVHNGYFIGLERNHISAFVNVISKIAVGFVVVLTADYGLSTMATMYFILTLISSAILYFVFRHVYGAAAKQISRISYSPESKRTDSDFGFGAFVKYYFGVSVFNLSSFLLVTVTGLVVGKYAFSQFAYYSLAITLVTAIVGFINSGLSPLMQPLVRLSHDGDEKKIDRLMYDLTVLISLFSLLLTIFMIHAGNSVLTLWIGNQLASNVYAIYVSLLAVNLARLAGAPLGLLFLAKARQNEVLIFPLLEGVTSVAVTLILIQKFGMFAVPIGLSISATIILWIYSFKLTPLLGNVISTGKYKIVYLSYPFVLCILVYFNVFMAESLIKDKVAVSTSVIVACLSVVLMVKTVRKFCLDFRCRND